MKNILITGGAGFIGSHVVNFFVNKYSHYKITNIDSLTYASNYSFLSSIDKKENYVFYDLDIRDSNKLEELIKKENYDSIIHLAAESHVDNSIKNPTLFAETNILGTINLLNSVNKIWKSKEGKRFYHISTDEVYGTLGATGSFKETTPYDPRSPYSASKASSDHFVRSYYHTYEIPILISNCSNNFGPNQHKEKLIPVVINSIINNKKIPVYGNGLNIRDWLYVQDHVNAIDKIFHDGSIGETYNIGGGNELTNLELIKNIIKISASLTKKSESSLNELIEYVSDRKGHDYRYSIDYSKISNFLNWKPKFEFETALEQTIKWYLHK
ncbi:dTDP-glucose 4,6-dehydratase [Flavobacteriaceae bacterium]|jgi:dTDP-glucose 4,6-dehydratase|nr:dTDP-glucose 4,6-dehydratase [Flavobacteriaceae bacterium]MDC6473203.1 dTDP-glucose 4,6-dehydratase [Flavobacteriaceae bacterium]|tara:strand:- start:593 stop:1573 length:981 start_codon:yes stop_codon:yes gene_type:complete